MGRPAAPPAATSTGPAIASTEAGNQRANSPSSASIRSTTIAVKLARMLRAKLRRAGMQQARQRIAAQPPAGRCAGVEGRAVGSDGTERAEQCQQGEACQWHGCGGDAAGECAAQDTSGTPSLADR